MNFNARIIHLANAHDAAIELNKIGCDRRGIHIMAPKAIFKTIKLEGIATKDANLLKQTFLAKGGEVAVSRGTADLSVDYTDVLICATLKQYRMALAQLKLQPWGLPAIARIVESLITEATESSGIQSEENWWVKSDRTMVMGILNLTPDSFSDGGKYNQYDAALRHAEEMIREGADIIDVGAESTRPYGDAKKISAEEEMERLLPLLERLASVISVPISVDTYKAEVAAEAVKRGARMINDIWGLQYDSKMAKVASTYNIPIVIMHNQEGTTYTRCIMSHICEYLYRSVEIAMQAGIPRENLIIDPGIGFGKTPKQNLQVMSRLEELKAIGCPILLGTSRKRFIGEVLDLPVEERVEGTGATIAVGITKGVSIVRVHDVKAAVRVAKMTDAMIRSGGCE